MFTGIVESVGTVVGIEATDQGRRLHVRAPEVSVDLDKGDSVAVNGVCLTVVDHDDEGFAVEAVKETLDRSNLGVLAVGGSVDLERPMAATGRFDGHIVQGHVDGTGVVEHVAEEGGARRVRVALPAGLAHYVVEKGSITVDGVSLTVTAVDGDAFEFVLIPHTIEVTELGRREVGDLVNLEVDVIAKYVERMLEAWR